MALRLLSRVVRVSARSAFPPFARTVASPLLLTRPVATRLPLLFSNGRKFRPFSTASDQNVRDQFEEAMRELEKRELPAKAEILQWLRRFQAEDFITAQYHLASVLLDAGNLGYEKKEAEGVRWLRRAAEQNLAEAQLTLGDMLSRLDKEAHLREGVEWLRKAADQGVPRAQFLLSLLFLNGRGVKADHNAAVEWAKKAADQGYALAQFNYAIFIMPKNKETAIKYLRKAAEQGVVLAQQELAKAGQPPVTPNPNAGAQPELAWQSDARSQYNAAVTLIEKRSADEQDHKQAVEWMRKAADQNYPEALFQMARFLATGFGCAVNKEEAAKYLRKAADLGDQQAEHNLAVMMLDGDSMPSNPIAAVKIFRKLAEAGYAMAQFSYGSSLFQGVGVQQDEKAGVEYLRKAADRDVAPAQFWLGFCLFEGRGAPHNLQEAARWFREAAEQQFPDADRMLASVEAEIKKETEGSSKS